MKLVFIFGPAASGKLTIARELSALTGLPVFHNHLVVDALLEKLRFGEPEFVRLREAMWMAAFETAAKADQPMIFTFQPEPTVDVRFPARVVDVIEGCGGKVKFVKFVLPDEEQERRIANDSRREFKKLTSLDLLRQLRSAFKASEAAMPPEDLLIDTGLTPPTLAALQIAEKLGLSTLPSRAGAA